MTVSRRPVGKRTTSVSSRASHTNSRASQFASKTGGRKRAAFSFYDERSRSRQLPETPGLEPPENPEAEQLRVHAQVGRLDAGVGDVTETVLRRQRQVGTQIPENARAHLLVELERRAQVRWPNVSHAHPGAGVQKRRPRFTRPEIETEAREQTDHVRS